MTLATPNWLSWYTKDDQYSKQKLQAPTWRRCAASTRTAATSSSTSSPRRCRSRRTRKRSSSRSTSARAPRYTVSAIGIAGELVVAEPELRALVAGQARRDVLALEDAGVGQGAVASGMGADGYAFANINAVPEIDRTNNTVAFTFYVDAGRRVYVRKINISGNPKTRDEVIRREMRQLEERLVRRHAHRAVEGARAAPGLLRGRQRQRRDAAGAGHHRPGRHRDDASPRRTPATCSPASATRARKASCSTRRCRSRTSSAPATRWRCRSTPARSTARSR